MAKDCLVRGKCRRCLQLGHIARNCHNPPRAWGDVQSSVGGIINDNPDPILAEAAATTDAAEVMEVDVSGSPHPRASMVSRASAASQATVVSQTSVASQAPVASASSAQSSGPVSPSPIMRSFSSARLLLH